MRVVNLKGLKRIGWGAFSEVYKLSQKKVIKVYTWYEPQDLRIVAEEIELSHSSEYTLPVLETAIARKGNKLHYAVIKKYLPYPASKREATKLRTLIRKEKVKGGLILDCYGENVRKDKRGKFFLVDTQGTYAFRVLDSF